MYVCVCVSEVGCEFYHKQIVARFDKQTKYDGNKREKKLWKYNTIDKMAKKTGKIVEKFWADDKSIFVN